MEPLLLTVEETAQTLRISRNRVYDLIRLNQLKSVKLGASRRIPIQCLQDYVADLTQRLEGQPR
jgi:excisionase family DNA binding protein